MINDHIIETLPKTFNLAINKKTDKNLIEVLLSLSLVNKNLYNTALFVVKNIYSSYVFDKDTNTYNLILKSLMHDNQKNMIDFVNGEIDNFNKVRLEKYNKKALNRKNKELNTNNSKNNKPISKVDDETNNTKTKLKNYIEFNPFSNIIGQETYKQLLNPTFLQYLVDIYSKKQSQEAKLEVSDYELLPGRIRQNCIQSLIDNYFIYFKSLKSFNDGKIVNGRPSIPKYKSKNSSKTFEIPRQALTKNNKLIKLKYIEHLYKDYDKKIKLSNLEIKAYKDFNYKNLLDTVKKLNNIDILEKPLLLKFVPKSFKNLIIQSVFNTYVKINQEKVLSKTITKIKSSEDFNSKKYTNLLGVKNTAIVKALKSLSSIDLLNLNAAGIDLGITNVLSMGYYLSNPKEDYSNQLSRRGQIYSSRDYTRQINCVNRKLDNLQKRLANKVILNIINKSSEIKIENEKILNKKDRKKLSPQEISLLNEYQKSIYEDVKYRQILDKKNNFINDYIHKLTSNIVNNLIKNKVELVVAGKNIGWKTNSNMGKRMNRAFYSIPHAQIINMLKYKCFENNILLVTTEESYTSKSSFINNVKLKQFDRNNNKYVEQKEYINIYKLDDKIDYTKENEIESCSLDNKTEDLNIKSEEKENKDNVISKTLIKEKTNNISKELKINKKPGPIKTTKTNNNNIVSGNEKCKEYNYTDKIADFGGLRDPNNSRKYKNINYDKNNKAKYTFIHSDLNGAYNIIKKIIDIKYDKRYCSRKCDIVYTNLLFKQKIEQYA